ncbi:hypothetical protein [Desulfotalea psychrophila]|uniref:Uncharacterized protein n=1 Tax=Desulfotalea psychrophila (strain LSv54 / DSM 12343) TaxID=177439 RepID=Q6AMV5_DESPS|nr:hypothetical protein [Desulfotalea psychrophila]CAG36319.1 unknown protein [Desulfotalea psychrophila LSv54]
MIQTKAITFNGRQLIIKELTVPQIDAWEKTLSNHEETTVPSLVEMLVDSALPLSAVRLAVPELTDADLLADIAPSQWCELYREVEEVNSFLSQMVEKMAKLGEALVQSGKIPIS